MKAVSQFFASISTGTIKVSAHFEVLLALGQISGQLL